MSKKDRSRKDTGFGCVGFNVQHAGVLCVLFLCCAMLSSFLGQEEHFKWQHELSDLRKKRICLFLLIFGHAVMCIPVARAGH